MSFTDQQPRIATAEDLKAPWSGGKNGKYFRCNLCGHKFKEGDQWRFVFGDRMANIGESNTTAMDFKDQDAVEAEREQLVELRSLANALGAVIIARDTEPAQEMTPGHLRKV